MTTDDPTGHPAASIQSRGPSSSGEPVRNLAIGGEGGGLLLGLLLKSQVVEPLTRPAVAGARDASAGTS
jgi:hypothetical protein